MKKYLTLLLLVSIKTFGSSYPACNFHEARAVPLLINGENAKLEVTLKNKFCYAATIHIKVISHSKVMYSYSGEFQPRSGINWQQMTKADARDYLDRVFDSSNFKKCSEMLPSILPTETYYDYNRLFIPANDYESYRASSCMVFINNVHYEYSQYVIFPMDKKEGIVASEFGI